jgi:hypothetical protein
MGDPMTIFKKAQLNDQYNFVAECTPMDELRVAQAVRLVGSTFVGSTIDTNFWTATIAASGGTIATADLTTMPGALTLSSKTDATGSVIVQSNRYARYTGGNSNRYRAQVQFGDTGKTDNVKRWGIFDGTNGAYFKLAGTALSVNTMKAGSETSVASASWNGSTTTPTLTNVNTYEIYITNSKVYFVIGGVLVHTVSASTSTWTATTTLPVRMDNINAGNTTDTVMYIRVATIYRLGPLETLPTYKHITSATTTVCKLGAGNLHRLVVNNPTAHAITFYDNTSATGTVIAIVTPQANSSPFTLEYHLPFATGLTVVTAGTPDLTVVYE